MTECVQSPPLILDFDGSVLPLSAAEIRIHLEDWQETARFGCSLSEYARLEEHLGRALPQSYGCVFTGSGDFHHLSLFLLRRLAERQKTPPRSLTLVVLDNHPDNMRYPFGLHCGSWVRHAASLDCIRHIHVLGLTSGDVGPMRAWENYLSPFLRKRLTYWSVNAHLGWLRLLGRGAYGRSFENADALVEAFLPVLGQAEKVYLSLDKDVFSPDIVKTNWDQGVMEFEHARAILSGCSGKLAGADVTGDVSRHVFKSRFKRLLSRLDGQETPPPEKMRAWRAAQQSMNKKLLPLLVPLAS